MDWYAVQILTGKEQEVFSTLRDKGVEVIMPCRPLFIRHSNSIVCIEKPLMPGYMIARLEVTDFYKYQKSKRIEKMMIRICGNGYDAVPLNKEEIAFFRLCENSMEPLILKKQFTGLNKTSQSKTIDILNPPPWADKTSIEWYDIDRFKAKLRIHSSGVMKDRSFTIAAYDVNYTGKYLEQLQGLSQKMFGKFGLSMQQAFRM